MTAQDHAPSVPVEQTGTAGPAPQEHPVIAHLRSLVEEADRRRLNLATKGGHARQAAREQEALAARYDDEALAAHAQMDTWQALLDTAREEVANEARKIAAIRADRTPASALATVNAETPEVRPSQTVGQRVYPPMRYCNGCGKPLRPPTPDEQAAATAGQPLPDVRRDCPTCLLAAAQRPSEERAR